jgi:predicted site-specific integrase-resolvase
MKTLQEYADENRISYQTAWSHFKEGKIPRAYKNQFSRIMIDDLPRQNPDTEIIISLLREILETLKK